MDNGDWKARWRSFLEAWSREALASGQTLDDVPPEVAQSGWLGYPGATEEQLVQAEARLGVQMPPSYRAFLSVTNGWRRTAHRMERLWSTRELAGVVPGAPPDVD